MHLTPLIILVILQVACTAHAVDKPSYAVATEATPVLNRADFQSALTTRDECGQLRAVEFVALPGTVFTITGEEKTGSHAALRVTTEDYPYPTTKGYYVDSRSVQLADGKPAQRLRRLPTEEAIIAGMKTRLGKGYVWGGNVAEGVTDRWGDGRRTLLAGLDCSGLLYEATAGYTPRNTSSLATYGRGVPIAGKGAAAIAAGLRPLDLIVWPGHVLIVIDGGNVIESRLVCGNPAEGVRIRPATMALAEIMKSRRPTDRISGTGKEFVVRRWHESRLVDR